MAKPDLDDGYFQIAYELMAAVAAAGFNRGAQVVLFEVFAQIYGLAKRRVATLSPTEIAGRLRADRSNIHRSIRELVAANVLVKLDENTFKFNKDYESWKLKETPEQRSLRLSYCKVAPHLAKSFAYDAIVNPDPPAEPISAQCVVNSDNAHQSHQQKAVVNSDNAALSILTTRRNPETSICSSEGENPTGVTSDDAARREIPPLYTPPVGVEKGEISSPTATGAGVAISCSESIPNSPPSSEGSLSSPLISDRYAGATVEARMNAWARQAFGDRYELECLCQCIHAQIESRYPPAWIEEAILTAAAAAKRGMASYVNQLLIRWHKQGGPPPPAHRNGAVPAPALPPPAPAMPPDLKARFATRRKDK